MRSQNIQFRIYEASVLLIRALLICLVSFCPLLFASPLGDTRSVTINATCEAQEMTFHPLETHPRVGTVSLGFGLSKCPLDLLVSLGRKKALRHMTVSDFRWIKGIGRKLSVRAYSSRHLKSWRAFSQTARLSKVQLRAVRKWVYINE